MKYARHPWALLIIACAAAAWAQAPAASTSPSVGQILDRQIGGVESEFVPAAEAMPEDKYNFAPTSGEFKGVRTYAQQIKHVAAVNYVVFAAIAGEKPPADTGGESGPDSVKTKAEIIKYLKDSFAYAHKVAAGITKESTTDMVQSPFGSNKVSKLGLAAIGISHPFDHYGQMVVYLRMNGIIPPASRAQ
ncbi:MAG TPA: DinB family protein [Terriglobales bacterium]|nr:DinB family protein [Terriglobales bacterium]